MPPSPRSPGAPPPGIPAREAHPVPGQHLGSVLVLDLDDAGGLDPGFSIHLHGDALVPADGDLHHAALRGRTVGAGTAAAPGSAPPKTTSTTPPGPTWAMRWCCRLMTRDTAIWMLPKTATTSSFLSSNEGAPKFCGGAAQPGWAQPSPPRDDGKARRTTPLPSPRTHVVLLGASPKIDAPGVAGDVEHGDALQAGQRDGHPIALQERG